MDSGMVERVARVLARRYADELSADERAFASEAEWAQENWALFIDDARAAIEAMREPTEAMLDAGGHASDAAWLMDDRLTPFGTGQVDLGETMAIVPADSGNVYRAMIGAALTLPGEME